MELGFQYVNRLQHVARSFARQMWLVGRWVVLSYKQLVGGSVVWSCGRSEPRLFGRRLGCSVVCSGSASIVWWSNRFLCRSVTRPVGGSVVRS